MLTQALWSCRSALSGLQVVYRKNVRLESVGSIPILVYQPSALSAQVLTSNVTSVILDVRCLFFYNLQSWLVSCQGALNDFGLLALPGRGHIETHRGGGLEITSY